MNEWSEMHFAEGLIEPAAWTAIAIGLCFTVEISYLCMEKNSILLYIQKASYILFSLK